MSQQLSPQSCRTIDFLTQLLQNYTVEKLFRTADDFYASMGLRRAPETLFEKSMMRKPADGRQVLCHATAWDFHDKKV